ncbi:MAG: TIGR00180 family glycosyltransferase [Betaproteobacteria bacterium]|nr:TIGR00180 family glycosyltransferase [Betaproteobacteria bacterium]
MLIDDSRNFALLVPTFEGTPFLRRTLDFLRARRYPGRIVLSDNSSGAHRAFVSGCAADYPELDLLVLQYPESIRFLDKLRASLESIESEFVMLHAQDDFAVPEAMEECVRLLTERPDHSAARGRVAMFALSRMPAADGTSPVGLSFIPHPMREYLQDDPLDRILAHLERYASTFYSVRRRSLLLEAYAVTERDTKNVIFFQYLSSAVAALQGKIACIDRLFYVRQGHAASWSAGLKAARDPEHWPMLITSPHFSRYYCEFRSSLCRMVADRLGVPAGESGPRIDAAAVGLFQRGFCGREIDNPAESQFVKRLNDAASPEQAHVRGLVDFIVRYPDTY